MLRTILSVLGGTQRLRGTLRIGRLCMTVSGTLRRRGGLGKIVVGLGMVLAST